jgi:hypothetical protein
MTTEHIFNMTSAQRKAPAQRPPPWFPPHPRRGLSFLLLGALLWSSSSFAQASAVSAPTPLWQTLLVSLLPVAIGAALAIHPLLKLASWLHARALDANASAAQRAVLLGTESLARSIDHFLEVTGSDFSDLASPAKRQAALTHLEQEAKAGALPAVTDAVKAMGSNWLAGAASAAVDAAAMKADPPSIPDPPPTRP